ncbi:MAG: hypothetical protein ACTHJW_00520 [Streptosporangiaceae bacterium]
MFDPSTGRNLALEGASQADRTVPPGNGPAGYRASRVKGQQF